MPVPGLTTTITPKEGFRSSAANLLIAQTFASLFLLAGLFVPDAFSGITFEDTTGLASQLIYFSFATLTTVGYGDIVPVRPIARSLCNVEAIFGQLFPATLLARLVSLELQERV